MYNAHSYAYRIERMLKLPMNSADAIAHNPLQYLKGFLDKEYEKSDVKARLIDAFDDKYGKYMGMSLEKWEENDTIQMVNDLKEIFR